MEHTDNPPPKNATWMLRYFTGQGSPSAVMRRDSSHLWRTNVEVDSGSTSLNTTNDQLSNFKDPGGIYQNAAGQRIDVPQEYNLNPALIAGLKSRRNRLCHTHYFHGTCVRRNCPYDHNSILTDPELDALRYISRSQRCPNNSNCVHNCLKGHMCPNSRYCRHGNECRFAGLHDIDTTIIRRLN